MLLTCSKCGAKCQAREGEYSHAYQVKKKSKNETKSIVIHLRVKPSRVKEILASRWHSPQRLLDSVPLE